MYNSCCVWSQAGEMYIEFGIRVSNLVPCLNPSSPPSLGGNFRHAKASEKTMCSKGK